MGTFSRVLATTAVAALAGCLLAIPANANTDQPPTPACHGRPADRERANPSQISAAAYNHARSILASVGSYSAAKSHPIHGHRSVPVGYGTSLLACARDEFRSDDRAAPVKKSGMAPYHWQAIHDAARRMGITRW
ncbi:hypothetical protein [Actinomadura oligospora]|uniref:hypothetical protein n=1 Tax=Actinomadura oligospora TaxID=111804 RepID=UPI0012F90828|nr:hypothetical protein [Actinomadura oligospora]